MGNVIDQSPIGSIPVARQSGEHCRSGAGNFGRMRRPALPDHFEAALSGKGPGPRRAHTRNLAPRYGSRGHSCHPNRKTSEVFLLSDAVRYCTSNGSRLPTRMAKSVGFRAILCRIKTRATNAGNGCSISLVEQMESVPFRSRSSFRRPPHASRPTGFRDSNPGYRQPDRSPGDETVLRGSPGNGHHSRRDGVAGDRGKFLPAVLGKGRERAGESGGVCVKGHRGVGEGFRLVVDFVGAISRLGFV